MINLKRIFACIIIIAFVFTGCGIRLVNVDGPAMHPTIQDGDIFIMVTSTERLRHSDIIVIEIPIEGFGDKIIITRIIGLPGDEINIDFDSGLITRNGNLLLHEMIGGYLYESGHRINTPTNHSGDMADGIFTVPENHLFVLSDNRNNSFLDSRSDLVGFVDIDNVMGIATNIIF